MLPEQYQQYADVFDPDKADELPPHRPGIDHHIPLETDEDGKEKEVPWGALYNMSRDELLVLRKTLTELLDKNFIRLSKSPAGAPVLFAKKPGGGLRFCVDYRGLNAVTRKDRYPLPLIRETLGAMSKAKWLTKLDVSAAFYKIRIKKGEEWKTAFRTRYGLYEWMVTPFGLTGAPATFQRYINWVLREYLDDFCTAYIDDILVYSSGSREDHSVKVSQVLEKLRDAGLQLDLSKCEFEAREVKYLGYIIEVGKGISMDPEKVEAVKSWVTPKTVKGVRSFLGFANYYRIFIEGFAITAEPLTRLTKKGAKFEWSQRCEEAFQALKEAFINGPILAIYDPDRETRLEPDASGWASGGLLTQYDPGRKAWRPVAFLSTKHTPAECNYDIHDKELLAVMKCIAMWNAELKGLSKPFLILTDHQNLKPFMTKKKLTERQVRWAQTLAGFNFRMEHRPGSLAKVPDALSRREQDLPQDVGDDRLAERERTLLPEEVWTNVGMDPVDVRCALPVADENETPFADGNLQRLWKEGMESDAGEFLKLARRAVHDGARKFPSELKLPIAIGDCDEHNGYLRHRERLWLPLYEPLTTAVIQDVHDSVVAGHPGRDATMALVTRQFFWPGMSQDIRRFVRNCDVCGRTTIWRTKKQGLLKPLPVPDRIWQEISVDYMVDLPESDGCENLLVITDRLGKGTILIPVPEGKFDALGFAELFVERYVSQHWLPRGIVSDRGVQWVNGFWKEVCRLLGIERRLSTAYHPETDGATERRNQEVQAYLRAFIAYNQKDWRKWLPMAQIAIDGKPSTTTGISPFFMTHGYDVRAIETSAGYDNERSNPSPRERGEAMVAKMKEAYEWAQAAMAAAQQTQQEYANRGREAPTTYKVGDKVWLHLKNFTTDRPCKKLDWLHAKYTVTKVLDNKHVYELDVPRGVYKRFHTSLLRPAAVDPLPSQTRDDPQPPALIIDDEEEWLVEEIMCARWTKRGRGRRRMALVKWRGFSQPTWEPVSELKETVALDAYEEKYGNIDENDGPLGDYFVKANERGERRGRAQRENSGRICRFKPPNNETTLRLATTTISRRGVM